MSAGALVAEVAREAAVTAGESFREAALDIIAGQGGVLFLVLALLGVALLAYDLGWILVRLIRGWMRRRRPVQSREARVRGLATLGAGPAEIARAVGLPRDALTLVLPREPLARRKVPVAAPSAAPTPEPSPSLPEPEPVQMSPVDVLTQTVPPGPTPARPLPLPRSGNANVPFFGEAA